MRSQARSRSAILLALAGAALLVGVVSVAITLTSDHVGERGLIAGLGLVVGWSFIGTGLFAWWRRPDNRMGALMAAVGFAWFASALSTANDDLLFTIGIAFDALFAAVMGQLVLAFPTGRLHTRSERVVVAATYLVVTVAQVPSLLFEDDARNQLVIERDQSLSDLLDALPYLAALAVIVVSLAILVRRWRAATPPQRRALAPVM